MNDEDCFGSLLESDDRPFTEKVTVWSDAQWNEAQKDVPDGRGALPGFIEIPYLGYKDPLDIPTMLTSTLMDNPKRVALVLAGYAQAVIEISRIANALADGCGIDKAGFDSILKTANVKKRKFQRMAHGE